MKFQISIVTVWLFALNVSPFILKQTKSYLKLKDIRSVGMQSKDFLTYYDELTIPTLNGIHFTNISPHVQNIITSSGVTEGIATVIVRHTTAAVTINEMESRLIDDTRQFLLKLVPAAHPYLHNDIHLRDVPIDWPGGKEAWTQQEAFNVRKTQSEEL